MGAGHSEYDECNECNECDDHDEHNTFVFEGWVLE